MYGTAVVTGKYFERFCFDIFIDGEHFRTFFFVRSLIKIRLKKTYTDQ